MYDQRRSDEGVHLPAVVVKTFVGVFNQNDRWSIRRWDDGSFQVFHDNPFEGINQPYASHYRQVSGRFATVDEAEAELFRTPEFGRQEPT